MVKKGSLTRLANAAFQRAAAVVIARAKQTGAPVIVWEDGRVKRIPFERMIPRIAAWTRKKGKR